MPEACRHLAPRRHHVPKGVALAAAGTSSGTAYLRHGHACYQQASAITARGAHIICSRYVDEPQQSSPAAGDNVNGSS